MYTTHEWPECFNLYTWEHYGPERGDVGSLLFSTENVTYMWLALDSPSDNSHVQLIKGVELYQYALHFIASLPLNGFFPAHAYIQST